jgi:hypothetical protein
VTTLEAIPGGDGFLIRTAIEIEFVVRGTSTSCLVALEFDIVANAVLWGDLLSLQPRAYHSVANVPVRLVDYRSPVFPLAVTE